MIHFVRMVLENVLPLGFLCFLLVTIPMMGIMAIHERKN